MPTWRWNHPIRAAGERTWALLAQVAGRAGRGEKPGRALVQTYSPEHALMQALRSGDRDAYTRRRRSSGRVRAFRLMGGWRR
jgi:primosomal protein N'